MTPVCVEIPAGKFLLGGSLNDKFANATEFPATEMSIAQPFFLSKDPITVSDWAQWPGAEVRNEHPSLPVTRVSWNDAMEYCDWLSNTTAESWRLPHEFEWEYACRAGTTTPFSTGEMIEPDQANYLFSETGERIGKGKVTECGAFAPNAFGLRDMHGNVCEWTLSPWKSSYDPAAPEDSVRKTIRGGAWDYLPRMLRSSWRDGLPGDTKRDNLGFRVLKEML